MKRCFQVCAAIIICHQALFAVTFFYQGRLETANNVPANGVYDFKFAFYSDPNGVHRIGDEEEGAGGIPIIVSDGIFATEVPLPTQDMVPLMKALYLKIDVRLSNSGGEFWPVGRPQKIGVVPRALFAQNGAFPGEVKAWAGELEKADGSNNLPPGWLVCDGALVLREKYRALFEAIGTAWGSGDKETTFSLPDLRGRFLRGMDKLADGTTPVNDIRDPDAKSRTALGDNLSEDIGSVQDDEVFRHNHRTRRYGYGDGLGRVLMHGPGSPDDLSYGMQLAGDDYGGNETRPKNANVYWIIYAGVTE